MKKKLTLTKDTIKTMKVKTTVRGGIALTESCLGCYQPGEIVPVTLTRINTCYCGDGGGNTGMAQ